MNVRLLYIFNSQFYIPLMVSRDTFPNKSDLILHVFQKRLVVLYEFTMISDAMIPLPWLWERTWFYMWVTEPQTLNIIKLYCLWHCSSDLLQIGGKWDKFRYSSYLLVAVSVQGVCNSCRSGSQPYPRCSKGNF